MASVLTRLNQVLTFTAVSAGGTVALSHAINVQGVSVRPDLIYFDNASFSFVSCTPTVLTVKNNAATTQTLDAWLERKHTIDRAFGGKQVTFITPHPFVVAGATSSGGGGGSSVTTIRYVATGAEGSDFFVTLPAARANDTYKVSASCAGVAQIFGMDMPDLLAGDRTLTQFRVVTTGSLTVGDQIDFIVAD